MRLAGAAVAESNNIVVGDDIFTTGRFENERLVERRNGSEVERVEILHRGKAGGADAALDHAPFAIDEFDLGEDELLDRIEADGAEPDGVERGRGDERVGKDLYQPQRPLDELAFAAIAHADFQEPPQMLERFRKCPILQGSRLVQGTG